MDDCFSAPSVAKEHARMKNSWKQMSVCTRVAKENQVHRSLVNGITFYLKPFPFAMEITIRCSAGR